MIWASLSLSIYILINMLMTHAEEHMWFITKLPSGMTSSVSIAILCKTVSTPGICQPCFVFLLIGTYRETYQEKVLRAQCSNRWIVLNFLFQIFESSGWYYWMCIALFILFCTIALFIHVVYYCFIIIRWDFCFQILF